MTIVNGREWRGNVDILWGSTPCQTFSFAGLRRGLFDGRGQLTLAFAQRVEEIDPTYVCWENVKGVLSDRDNAFGCLLGALAGEDVPLLPPRRAWPHAGYVLGPKRTVAWRIFDAQHSGVPQRRERVFLVASSRDGADPRDILFEREGVRRDLAPRRPAGSLLAYAAAGGVSQTDLAGTLKAKTSPAGQLGPDDNFVVDLTNVRLREIAGTLDAAMDRGNRGQGVVCATGQITHALKAEGGDASEDGTGRGNPIVAYSIMPQNSGRDYKARLVDVLQPLMGRPPTVGNQGGDVLVQAFGAAMRGRDGGATIELTDELSSALRGGDGGGSKALVLLAWIGEQIGARVRRLTPRECERLQDIPDDHTLVPYRGKPATKCPDGPRYKAIGNGLNRLDVAWIGARILRFHRERGAQ